MTVIEAIALSCVYLAGAIIFFAICGGIMWTLEKVGFTHWLRGWLWNFGLIDECPDTENDR